MAVSVYLKLIQVCRRDSESRNYSLTSCAIATEVENENLQKSTTQMKIFCAISPVYIAKNMVPMPYAASRNFGLGFAIRTTEDRILILANLLLKL